MKKSIILFLINVIILLCLCDVSYCDIFKYVGEDGKIHLTNVPSNPDIEYVLIKKENKRFIGKKWILFFDNWYYQRKTFSKSSNVVSVWVLHIYTDEEKSRMNINTDHFISLLQCDCNKRIHRILKSNDYDFEGSIQSSGKSNEWDYVVPDTIGELLLETFCSSKTTNVKMKK